MGFFDSLLKIEIPHRKFGVDARDYCVVETLSVEELLLIKEFGIDASNFLSARIGLRVNMFNFFFAYYEKQHPDSAVGAAQGFFFNVVQEHYAGLPEPFKSKANEHYPGRIYPSIADVVLKFCHDVSGKDIESTSEELKKELVNYGSICAESVSAFFKKNMRKLA